MRRRSTRVVIALVSAATTLAAPARVLAQTTQGDAAGRTFSVTPTGFIQLDARSFHDWGEAQESTRMQRATLEVRRLRVGAEGQWHGTRFDVSVDPFDDDGIWLMEARVEARPRNWLRLHAGQFKLPGGREYDTSSRRLGFLERSVLSDSLAAGRDLGAMAEMRWPKRLVLSLGAFAGDGLGREERAGPTAAARVAWDPMKDLSVASYGSFGTLRAGDDSDPANGTNARSSSGFRFFDRLYVQGHRSRVGADARWSPGRWRVDGEVLRFTEDRQEQSSAHTDLPSLRGTGGVASVRWIGVKPSVGLRFERTVLDDTGQSLGTGSTRPRALDVRAAGVTALTASAGWTLTRWMRLLGESSAEWFKESTTAPVPGRTGPYLTLGVRLQFELP